MLLLWYPAERVGVTALIYHSYPDFCRNEIRLLLQNKEKKILIFPQISHTVA